MDNEPKRMRPDLDQQGEEELDEAFEEFLAAGERIQEKAKERLAESGEQPQRVLYGIDRKNGRIAIVPIDRPFPE